MLIAGTGFLIVCHRHPDSHFFTNSPTSVAEVERRIDSVDR
jgi:hypothetical protein